MKSRLFITTPLLLAGILLAQAEPTAPRTSNEDTPAAQGERGPRREGRIQDNREKLERIKQSGVSREDMERVRKAMEAAREDETVKAAKVKAEAAREELRVALKAYADSKGIAGPPSEGEKRERPTSEKMAEVRKAMEGARNDPAVKAAFEKSREAGDELRAAVKASILKSDPTLAPLIEKFGDLREERREERLGLGGDPQRGEGKPAADGQPRPQRPRGDKPAPAPKSEDTPGA